MLPLHAATASGERVTFKRRNRPRGDVTRHKTSGPFTLLSTSMHRLLLEADELRSLETAKEQVSPPRTDPRVNRAYDTEMHPTKTKFTTMWVDKYRPKKFSDLLGEDRVHRDVMGWLKEWDRCVFKRQAPKSKKRKVGDENTPVNVSGRGVWG